MSPATAREGAPKLTYLTAQEAEVLREQLDFLLDHHGTHDVECAECNRLAAVKRELLDRFKKRNN